MALALIVLAIGSVLAGYVGLPHALGGANRLERFLEPSFTVGAGARGRREPRSARRGHERRSDDARARADGGVAVVAVGGIGIALFFFLRTAARPIAWRRGSPACDTLLLNKYYVDEIYDAAIVQPIRIVVRRGAVEGRRRPGDRRRRQRRRRRRSAA